MRERGKTEFPMQAIREQDADEGQEAPHTAMRDRGVTEFPMKVDVSPRLRAWSAAPDAAAGAPQAPRSQAPSDDLTRSHAASGGFSPRGAAAEMERARLRLRTESALGMPTSPYLPQTESIAEHALMASTESQSPKGSPQLEPSRYRFRTESGFGMPVSPWAADGLGLPGLKGPCGGAAAAMPLLPPSMAGPMAAWSLDGSPVVPGSLEAQQQAQQQAEYAAMAAYYANQQFQQQAQVAHQQAAVQQHQLLLQHARQFGALQQAAPEAALPLHAAARATEPAGSAAPASPPRGGTAVAKAGAVAPTATAAAAASPGGAAAAGTEERGRTTVMLRNLPEGSSRDTLLSLLDSEGFAGRYDFAYLPVNFDTLTGLSHAFVNMVSPSDAERLNEHFEGFKGWATPNDSECHVVWNDKSQGLAALVERYRNSPVMHDAVPDHCKPIIIVGGRRQQFPPPTQKIKLPKVFKNGPKV